jgi:poly(glycerol-phosphate) alpha-glucosyltransferase
MTPECNLPEGFQAGAAIQLEPTETGVAAGLQALRRMNDAERNAMGQRARALVAERFTWPHIARQMESVHAWMLGGGGKPACFADF